MTLTCKNSKKIALNSREVGVLNQRLSWENVDLDQEMPLVSREAQPGEGSGDGGAGLAFLGKRRFGPGNASGGQRRAGPAGRSRTEQLHCTTG